MTDENKNINPELKLYIKEEAEKYRNQALGVFAFVGVVLGVVTYVGIGTFAKSAVNDQIRSNGMDAIIKAKTKAMKLVKQIEEIDSIFKDNDLVLISKTSKCPSGWNPWRKSQGLFLRGHDPSKKYDKNRKNPSVGSIQTDSVQLNKFLLGGGNDSNSRFHGLATTQQNIGKLSINDYYPDNGVETRPKNISVVFCVKSKSG